MLKSWLLDHNSLLICLLYGLSENLHRLRIILHWLSIGLRGLHIILKWLRIRLHRLYHTLHLTVLHGLDLSLSLHINGLLTVLSILHCRLLNLHVWHRICSTCAGTNNAVSIKVNA